MFKRTILAVGSMLIALALGNCSGTSDSSPADSRQFLSVGTAPPGGAFFIVGSALGEVLNQFKGENRWDVTSEATQGTMENIRRLSSGQLDFAMANAAITYFAGRGEGAWDRAYPMRSVMTLAPNVALFVTLRGSGLEDLASLKGNRIVVGPPGAGFEFFLRPILQAHGVTYEDFTPLNANQLAAVDMLSDGAAAAAFLGGAVPTASITQVSSSQDVLFIPYEEAAIRELLANYAFFAEARIPAGTYRNQDEDFNGLNVGSMHFITSAEMDEDLVYRVTKCLFENRQAVLEKHAAGRAINARNVVRNTGTEFHAGAIRYYREIGIWPEY